MRTKLDNEDFAVFSKYKWKAHKSSTNWYVRKTVRIKGKWINVTLHRLIMKAPEHLQVHHLNGNTLDNQKQNLRLCSNAENHVGFRRCSIKRSSQYRGVGKAGNKWTARMMVNYKNVYIGIFDSQLLAAKARDAFAFSLYKDKAFLNIKRDQKTTPR